MKQYRGTAITQQDDANKERGRWTRFLRWPLRLGFLGVVAYMTGLVNDWAEVVMLLGGLSLLILSYQNWHAGRSQRRWRRDSRMFEPPLPEPISAIAQVNEWRWPSHPVVLAPLGVTLIGVIYWVVVCKQMQLPGEWLVAMLLLALLNLWCWREPLLLVLLVFVGVTVLALIGWMIETFTLAGTLGLLLILGAAVAFGVIEFRKRKKKVS